MRERHTLEWGPGGSADKQSLIDKQAAITSLLDHGTESQKSRHMATFWVFAPAEHLAMAFVPRAEARFEDNLHTAINRFDNKWYAE